MDLVPLDEQRQLFISPSIDDWKPIEDHGITAVIDLNGDLDLGIPHIPNHMLYVYFPIFDEGLPDLNKLHAVARLGARLVVNGEKVLAHCGLGFNRSALVGGLVLTHWRKHRATGEVIVVRYADDSVLGFQYRADAERFLQEWRERLRKFGLELHPDKTRLIEFWALRSGESKTTWSRQARDVRLSGIYPNLWTVPEERQIPGPT